MGGGEGLIAISFNSGGGGGHTVYFLCVEHPAHEQLAPQEQVSPHILMVGFWGGGSWSVVVVCLVLWLKSVGRCREEKGQRRKEGEGLFIVPSPSSHLVASAHSHTDRLNSHRPSPAWAPLREGVEHPTRNEGDQSPRREGRRRGWHCAHFAGGRGPIREGMQSGRRAGRKGDLLGGGDG